MSDEIHPAHRAPERAVSPAPGPSTEASQHIPRPATTTNDPGPTTIGPTTASATAPSATTLPPPATHSAPVEEPLSLNQKLNNADRYWKFKGAFQVATIISGLIGIGTIGWVMATNPSLGYYFSYNAVWALWPGLITFAISIIWCVSCIAVLIHKKKPMFAGLRVTMDLLLWLGLLATALLGLLSLTELMGWGADGDLSSGFSSRYGGYELAANGTWIWESSSSSVTYNRDCNGTNYVGSYYSPYGDFKNCAEQDAYVNKLWQDKDHRTTVEYVAIVCQFLSVVLHFVLFVWACVDCHRYRHSRVSQDAEKLAASIVQTMISNGAIVPPPGQAHMKPIPWGQPGNYQLSSQQMYPMAMAYPQQQQYGAPIPQEQAPPLPPRPVVAGPSNEKSEGPRYA